MSKIPRQARNDELFGKLRVLLHDCLIFNAVGVPSQIGEIKASIPGLLAGITFAKGQQYTDFDAGIDEVAAYPIGELVADKVLAKVGLFALALRFWKIGLLAGAGARKRLGTRAFFAPARPEAAHTA